MTTPLIPSLEHWFRLNPGCIGSVDAVFTLTYAILMLNVDQHNRQAKRVQAPMTFADFKANLEGVDEKGFDVTMLEMIYNSIRCVCRADFPRAYGLISTPLRDYEIVLPTEQEG